MSSSPAFPALAALITGQFQQDVDCAYDSVAGAIADYARLTPTARQAELRSDIAHFRAKFQANLCEEFNNRFGFDRRFEDSAGVSAFFGMVSAILAHPADDHKNVAETRFR